MKTIFRSLLITIILLTACAPQSTATPAPAPAFTSTSFPTATPAPTQTSEPTQTLEPTPIPIPVENIPLNSCRQILESNVSSAGVLEVVYEGTSVDPLWMWSESTRAAVRLPVPLNGRDPKISTNHHWILFRRDGEETQSELWVIGVDGMAEKKLAAVDLDDQEIKARYPDAHSDFPLSLDYGWVPNTNMFFYSVTIYTGEGIGYHPDESVYRGRRMMANSSKPVSNHEDDEVIIVKFVLVDANSGRAMALANPLELEAFEFSPDGSQMAFLTQTELRALSTQDGQEQFTIQDSLSPAIYSPDSQYIIHFIGNGILRINARDGQQQIISLKYTIMSKFIGGGDGPIGPLRQFTYSPRFKWIGSSTLLATSLESDQPYVVRSSETDPNSWTFKVWKVDLADGTVSPSQTFSGDPNSVILSSDGMRLAFFKIELSNSPESLHLARLPGTLYIADLNTGEILETITDGQFVAWYPDSTHYIYSMGQPKFIGDEDHTQHYLGQVGGEATLLDGNVSGSLLWMDDDWIVGDCEIIHIIP